MPRGRTRKIHDVKQRLIERITSDYFQPGDKFFSIRYISTTFQISYQTVYRLVRELAEEGYIQLRPSSGAFIAGKIEKYEGVQFFFS